MKVARSQSSGIYLILSLLPVSTQGGTSVMEFAKITQDFFLENGTPQGYVNTL
jgi:hypothetical protein